MWQDIQGIVYLFEYIKEKKKLQINERVIEFFILKILIIVFESWQVLNVIYIDVFLEFILRWLFFF